MDENIQVEDSAPKFIKFVRIFLLILIIIGMGLLATQRLWAPKLVDKILQYDATPEVEQSWTTYANKDAGFTIRLPLAWENQASSSAGPWRFQSISFQDNAHGIGIPSVGNMWVDIAKGVCNNSSIDYVAYDTPDIFEKTVCKDNFQITFGLWQADSDLTKHKKILEQIHSSFIAGNLDEKIYSPSGGYYAVQKYIKSEMVTCCGNDELLEKKFFTVSIFKSDTNKLIKEFTEFNLGNFNGYTPEISKWYSDDVLEMTGSGIIDAFRAYYDISEDKLQDEWEFDSTKTDTGKKSQWIGTSHPALAGYGTEYKGVVFNGWGAVGDTAQPTHYLQEVVTVSGKELWLERIKRQPDGSTIFTVIDAIIFPPKSTDSTIVWHGCGLKNTFSPGDWTLETDRTIVASVNTTTYSEQGYTDAEQVWQVNTTTEKFELNQRPDILCATETPPGYID